MPGLSFRHNFKSNSGLIEKERERIITSLLHADDYIQTNLISTNFCWTLFTGHSKYPLKVIKNSNFEVFIEGLVYNKNDIELEVCLNKLYENLNRPDRINYLNKWIKDIDGDFIILVNDKLGKKYFILNDILGRLPCYFYSDEKLVLFSREIKFLFKQLQNKEIDKYSIAEYLLLAQPLGSGTFFKNIQYLPPASIIEIDLNEEKTTLEKVYDFDLEEKEHSNKGIRIITDNLTDLFLEATKIRSRNGYKNLLSLSGGFDSRALLGSLHLTKMKFEAVTFVGYNKTSEKDYLIAELLAKSLSVPWHLIKIKNPTGIDLLNLLKFKDGSNNLWQSFLLVYCQAVINTFGRDVFFFTGLGGNITFPNNTPTINLKDVSSLVKYIISNKYFFTLKNISRILHLKEQDIFDHLYQHFISYPEKNVNIKYHRYITVERGGRWTFETEDKNRFYFWPVAPLYAFPFYNYAMNIPDNLKSHYQLYTEFLSRINPISLKYKHALLGVPLKKGNLGYQSLVLFKDKVYPKLPSVIKRRIRMRLNKLVSLNIREESNINKLLNDTFLNRDVEKIFDKYAVFNLGSLNKVEYYILLTLLTSIEYFYENSSSLNNYLLEEFD
ncbi:MAG: hypothetical protein KGZ85_04970 [Ignavibacterium sp.]|nr:hypothetical protein [Ignavibacterium sp.]